MIWCRSRSSRLPFCPAKEGIKVPRGPRIKMPKAKSSRTRLLQKAFAQLLRHRSKRQLHRLLWRRVTFFRLRCLFRLPFAALHRNCRVVRTRFLLLLWRRRVQSLVESRCSAGEVRYAGRLLARVIQGWTRTAKQGRLLRQLAPFALTWRRTRLKRKTMDSWRRLRELRLRLNYEVIKKLRKRLVLTLAGWRKVVTCTKDALKLAGKTAKRTRKRRMELGFGLLRRNKDLQIRHWAIYRFLRLWKTAVYRSFTADMEQIAHFQHTHLLRRHFSLWSRRIFKVKRGKFASNQRLMSLFQGWKQAVAYQQKAQSDLSLKMASAEQHYTTRLQLAVFRRLAWNWSAELAAQRHAATLQAFQQHTVAPRLLARTFAQWKWQPVLSSARKRQRLRTLQGVWRDWRYCWKVGRMAVSLAKDTRKRILLGTVVTQWKGWAGPRAAKGRKAWRHRSGKLARNALFVLLEHSLHAVQSHQSRHFALLRKRVWKCWGAFLAKRLLHAQQASK